MALEEELAVAAAAAMASYKKIKVHNPVVEMDGNLPPFCLC